MSFLVVSFGEMAIAAWLGAYRVDREGKADGGIGTSIGSIIGRLQTSNYRPEWQRWVPLLWATFTIRILLVVVGIFLL